MSDYLEQLRTELAASVSYKKDTITLDNCDKEPIHLINQIQNYGYLLAFYLNNDSPTIDYASSNCADLLHSPLTAIIGQPANKFIKSSAVNKLLNRLKDNNYSHLESYPIDLTYPQEWQCLCNFNKFNNVLSIEFEPFLSDTIGVTSFDETKHNIIAEFTHDLFKYQSETEVANFITQFFHTHLRYDRVMYYRFDETNDGEVIAECKNQDTTSYFGLRFPASDIPTFARYLYTQNQCRMLVNRDSKPTDIIKSTDNPLPPLDLRLSNLRSMSPIHIEYLKNMQVMASLNMSLVKNELLTGMLIMHHQQPRYCNARSRNIILQLSAICSNYLRHIEQTEKSRSVQKQYDVEKLLNSYFIKDQDIDYAAISVALESIYASDGILIVIDEAVVYSSGIARVNPKAIIKGLTSEGLLKKPIFHTNNLANDLPQIQQLNTKAAGLLLISLNGSSTSFILFCKAEMDHSVKWAGRGDKNSHQTDSRLRPRKSFEEWREYYRGISSPWNSFDLSNAYNIQSIFNEYLLRKKQNKLTHMVASDVLTGLHNRYYITNKLKLLTAENIPFTLLIIDCDRFKNINDSLGHDIGDLALIAIAAKLKAFIRANTNLARLGGDEFIMLLQSRDRPEIEKTAAAIVEAFRRPLTFSHYSFYVPVSIGIAMADANSTRFSVMRNADMAMFSAKKHGGNSYAFESRELKQTAHERFSLEQNLYDAVKNGEIHSFYQPIVDVTSNKIVMVESLCRWRTNDGEFVLPGKFLSVAEQTGIIIPIGIKMIDNTLRDLMLFREYLPGLNVSINLCPLQLLDEKTAKHLCRATIKQHIDPSDINIEITEESYIEDNQILENIKNLRKSGFNLSIDDFGSGYSSLGYLNMLPVSTIKFDKSLIQKITDDKRSYELLVACQHMAEALNLKSVAEGIESEEQKNMIKEMGVSYQQGTLYSKPVSAEGLFDYIKSI